MKRFDCLFKRLRDLEPDPGLVEPWPPTEAGSPTKLLYDELREKGVELPIERPEPTPLLWLIKRCAEECFSDEEEAVDGAA
jgi:hypothetical protein